MKKEKPGQTVRRLRAAIPTFECEPGCHDCCGPVVASDWERKRLPAPDPAHRKACLSPDGLSCPHLGPDGCLVYDERPLVCRLYGTVPKLSCPKGRRPIILLSQQIEEDILHFARTENHALL